MCSLPEGRREDQEVAEADRTVTVGRDALDVETAQGGAIETPVISKSS
jgi:hypothetical protein